MSGAEKTAFIAVIGAPNAGKSTLVNRLVGQKVSIVSPKAQTTRSRVMGIVMRGETQLVFIDTPGIFAPRRRLDRAMVEAAWEGAADVDFILLLIDAALKDPLRDEETERVLAGLRALGKPAILALNKIDRVKREALLPLTAALDGSGLFSDIFMISAATGDGVDALLAHLAEKAPAGPHHFPPDQVSDAPARQLAAEIVREHLFRQLHQEIPYALTVETEAWEEFQDGSAKLSITVFVARANHKAIVLGKGGARIKAVREAAQRELEALFERRLHLFLFVKLRENWEDDPERYRALGLRMARET